MDIDSPNNYRLLVFGIIIYTFFVYLLFNYMFFSILLFPKSDDYKSAILKFNDEK